MIAMRYGTVPVVRKTGGLADTVIDAGEQPRKGNGFTFEPYRPVPLYLTVLRALKARERPRTWQGIVRRAMRADYSWTRSAAQYEVLYRRAARLHAAGSA